MVSFTSLERRVSLVLVTKLSSLVAVEIPDKDKPFSLPFLTGLVKSELNYYNI